MRSKSTAARCGAAPLPAVAQLSVPGFFFASSISSRSVFTPTLGFTATTSGEELTLLTGASSFVGWNADLLMSGLTRMLDGLARRQVGRRRWAGRGNGRI